MIKLTPQQRANIQASIKQLQDCLDRDAKVAQTKVVYQWRYKNAEQKHWKVAKSLLTPIEAEEYFVGCDIQRFAGPFEVTDA